MNFLFVRVMLRPSRTKVITAEADGFYQAVLRIVLAVVFSEVHVQTTPIVPLGPSCDFQTGQTG